MGPTLLARLWEKIWNLFTHRRKHLKSRCLRKEVQSRLVFENLRWLGKYISLRKKRNPNQWSQSEFPQRMVGWGRIGREPPRGRT